MNKRARRSRPSRAVTRQGILYSTRSTTVPLRGPVHVLHRELPMLECSRNSALARAASERCNVAASLSCFGLALVRTHSYRVTLIS
jgi:hypothetical protein